MVPGDPVTLKRPRVAGPQKPVNKSDSTISTADFEPERRSFILKHIEWVSIQCRSEYQKFDWFRFWMALNNLHCFLHYIINVTNELWVPDFIIVTSGLRILLERKSWLPYTLGGPPFHGPPSCEAPRQPTMYSFQLLCKMCTSVWWWL